MQPKNWMSFHQTAHVMRLLIDFVSPNFKFDTFFFIKILTVFKCGICVNPTEFKTSIELAYHVREQHTNIKHRQITPQNHREVVFSNLSSFECYICKTKFDRFYNARKHIQLHVQARNEKCDVCNERCTRKEFNSHMCVSSEKTIQCEYCPKSFGAIVKLIGHIETEHEAEKIQHRCEKCKRFFGMMRLRDLHVMQHKEEEKLYDCKICGKFFSSADKLSTHLYRHSIKST